MQETELISEIQRGNKDAFKDFVDIYKKFIINVCYKFVNNADDANDIAQDVFIEVYKSINNFRGDSRVNTWLYRISVNKSLNFLRNNKKYSQTNDISDESYKIPNSDDSDFSPDVSIINKERKNILDKAIDSLPENQKTAFILCKKEELSYEEISKVLGISVKAVESLIVRAKKNLQKLLINYYK